MQDLLHIINEPASPAIVVLGDLILDHYITGTVSRISPEAPIPVLHNQGEEHKLGGAANVAANIVSMGGHARLTGVLTRDPAGDIFGRLAGEMTGLDFAPVIATDRPTIVKTRVVAQHQQMLRIDAERAGDFVPAVYGKLASALKSTLKGAKLLILSDYGKGVLNEAFTRDAIKLARTAKIPVLVDPKGRDYSKYAGAYSITPNRSEAEAATGIACDSDANVKRAAQKLMDQLGLEVVVITLGAGGVAIQEKKGQFTRIPTVARQVFDVTGAGDTFIATFGVFLAQGAGPEEAARLANTAAGVKVGRFGAAAITRDEVRRSVVAAHEAFDHHAKIVSREDLAAVSESLRKSGRKVVFTNGCFDVLHAGHVTYLHWAKSKGDVLALGLNADTSVKRLKGEGRPVNNEGDRSRVLAALADVDFVCVFSEDTPEALIKAVKPDVLVKGEDWKGKDVAGAKFVKTYGGRVEFAPLLQGRSSSKTIEKMKSA